MTEQSNWRCAVLDQLIVGLADCFIVEDPDSLMTESGIQQVLIERGFEFYPFDYSIELRYFYELKIRASEYVDRENTDAISPLVISLDEEHSIRDLPFDITQRSKTIFLSLSDCFPDLYEPVLQCLEPEELDLLEQAVVSYAPESLGDNASRDFVLRHIYQLAPELIQSSADLLRTLLRLHYQNIVLPDLLKERFIFLLKKKQQFLDWPISSLVASRTAFFNFLQDQWSDYVTAVKTILDNKITETHPAVYSIEPLSTIDQILPFGHDDVRVYIDNLFLEGFLLPIETSNPEKLGNHWSLVGIKQDAKRDSQSRIIGLIKSCEETLPSDDSPHQAWQEFAFRWAKLCAIYHTQQKAINKTEFIRLREALDSRFKAWMLSRYSSLHNHPPKPAVMLHHIPRAISREMEVDAVSKSALIVIDGLALDQWLTLRKGMGLLHNITESAIFAWVPTLTSVSRQALFAAKSPYQFANTIQSTHAEPKLWKNYWLEQGLTEAQIFYQKSLGREDISEVIDNLSDHRLRAVGLVINTVDDIMHGMLLGSKGMHNQIKLWAEDGYLVQLINALIEMGFTIHITSDHGNIEASGCGKISEGAVADARGERTRIYQTEALRTEVFKTISRKSEDATLWPQTGLPADYWPVVMSGREAFVAEKDNIVGHGGIAIEEVIVPYIKIQRDNK